MAFASVNSNTILTEPLQGNSSPLGAKVVHSGVNLSLFSRDCTGVELLLFDRVDDSRPSRAISLHPQHNHTHHYWHLFIPGIGHGQINGYRISGPTDIDRFSALITTNSSSTHKGVQCWFPICTAAKPPHSLAVLLASASTGITEAGRPNPADADPQGGNL